MNALLSVHKDTLMLRLCALQQWLIYTPAQCSPVRGPGAKEGLPDRLWPRKGSLSREGDATRRWCWRLPQAEQVPAPARRPRASARLGSSVKRFFGVRRCVRLVPAPRSVRLPLPHLHI